MICIEPDGIWCKKCQKMHPTLFWHEKYNDYELSRKEKWFESIKRFKTYITEKDYIDSLPTKGLKQEEQEGNCVICNTPTFFKTIETDNYVCCDECKYKELGYKDD